MTRDISGRRLFSLNDVFAIAGGLLAIATLIGAAGGFLVLQYRVGQAEENHRALAADVVTEVQRNHEQDVLIARTVERLESISQTLAGMQARPPTKVQ